MSYQTKTEWPIRKVTAGGVAGAASLLIVWLLNTFVLVEPVPAEVAMALTTVLTFAVSYWTAPGEHDGLRDDEGAD